MSIVGARGARGERLGKVEAYRARSAKAAAPKRAGAAVATAPAPWEDEDEADDIWDAAEAVNVLVHASDYGRLWISPELADIGLPAPETVVEPLVVTEDPLEEEAVLLRGEVVRPDPPAAPPAPMMVVVPVAVV